MDTISFGLVWIALASSVVMASPETPPLRAVDVSSVTVNDRFWAARQQAGREGTLRRNIEQCEKTGRIANLEIAAGLKKGEFQGYFFNDSDVYKAIEGACVILSQTQDKALEAKIDSWINIIAAAQQPDGYVNSYYTVKAGLDKRYSNLRDMHELYCAGHLIEAGVAHHRATGKRTLLDVAIKFADLIESTFGPSVLGKSARRPGVPGHQELELALIKLADATGQRRYLSLAAYFIEQRGRTEQLGGGGKRELAGEYQQDHKPLAQHDEIVGHAVRATYFYAAVTDLLIRDRSGPILPPDAAASYSQAIDRVWRDLANTKMYITGGIGNSSHNEGFTTQYDLPNDTAYAETCAAIGNVLWNHRLALLHGADGAEYADVMERALYNSVLSGVSLDGDEFFYTNPLASRGQHRRQEWYACACCPPNLLRVVAGVGGYAYAQSDAAVFINLYIGSKASLTLRPGGTDVPLVIEQATEYPWEGIVNVALSMPRAAAFDVYLRLPAWCPGGHVFINDQAAERDADFASRGYIKLSREWKPGDRITFHMDMPVQRVHANPSVKPSVGRVALQRGPIVYCFESADLTVAADGTPRRDLRTIALPASAPIDVAREPDMLGGIVALRAIGISESEETGAAFPANALYSPTDHEPRPLTAIPYFAWANREPGEMLVWIPESLSITERLPDPEITPAASHCFESDTLSALYDGVVPSAAPGASGDHSIPRFTWWPRKASTQWVQYTFDSPREVSGVSVFWFDDRSVGGQCRLPVSWNVLYLEPAPASQAGAPAADIKPVWKEVPGATAFPVAPDTFNRVSFPAIRVSGLRLEAVLAPASEAAPEGYSAGVLEWRVESAR